MRIAPTNKTIQIQDVGVLLIGYNRPELLEKRILELSKSEVVNIYISIDGGKDSHANDIERLKKLAQNLLKNCKLSFKYHQKNLGMVSHITSEISNVLKIHEYIIVLEDDIQVTNNFFRNIIDGLNHLNKLEARGLVSGYSPFFNSKFKNKWRETHIFFCWGWACSRNTWAVYDFNIKSRRVNHELSHSESWQQLNSYQKKYWLTKIHHSKVHPLFTWDHQFIFHSFVNNFVNLSPVFSMVNNEGFDDDRAVHTKGKKPRNISDKKINNKKIYSMSHFSKLYSLFDFDNNYVRFKFKFNKIIKGLTKKQPQRYS